MAGEKEPKDGVKTLKDVYAGYAAEAAKKDKGEVEFSLLESYDVEFTKDFRNIKKGHKMFGISKVAHDLYDANGVIKVIKKKEGPNDKQLDEEETK